MRFEQGLRLKRLIIVLNGWSNTRVQIAQGKLGNKKEVLTSLINLPWMRFERMTYRLEGGCSIQLSYQGSISICIIILARKDFHASGCPIIKFVFIK